MVPVSWHGIAMIDSPTVFSRFVALGDSFTEGLDDAYPDGRYRGWADRLAERLQRTRAGHGDSDPLLYANLAVRGKLAAEVAREQVPVALAMNPDLVSLAAGVNDALRPRWDVGVVAGHLESSVKSFRATGCTVLLTCVGDPSRRSRAIGKVSERLFDLNARVRDIAGRYDCAVMDFGDAYLFDDDRLWAEDRLHLSPEGHRRVAAAAAEALGFGDDAWRRPLAYRPAPSWFQSRLADASWVRHHLAPWIVRRARGQSSGDTVNAKRPLLTPLLE